MKDLPKDGSGKARKDDLSKVNDSKSDKNNEKHQKPPRISKQLSDLRSESSLRSDKNQVSGERKRGWFRRKSSAAQNSLSRHSYG